jgi:putative flippase GtrA
MSPGLLSRLFTRGTALMLARNSAVSCTVFAVGLLGLWLLVDIGHVGHMPALAVSLLLSNSLHYALGRTWIFRGTQRSLGRGYVYFLINAAIGMVITMILFWALTRWTTINYLVLRVLVSLVAGLVIFLLNATLNFRRV